MKMKNSKSLALLFFIIFSLAFSVLNFFSGNKQASSYLIELTIKLPDESNLVEVFFDDDNQGYVAQKSVAQNSILQDGKFEFHIPIETKRFRIDPGTTTGTVVINFLKITKDEKSKLLSGKQLIDRLTPLSQVEDLRVNDDNLVFDSTGNDPYLDMAIPEDFQNNSTTINIAKNIIISTLISTFLTILFTKLSFKVGRLISNINKKISVGKKIDSLIFLDKLSIIFIGTLLLTGVLLVVFKINQSSIAMYDSYFPSNQEQKFTTLKGNALAIRSDEWLVQTPFILSQLMNGSNDINLNIGGERSPLLTAVPVSNIGIFFQPKFWGFYLLDIERGYSWLWAYKAIGSLLAFFILFLLLTKNNSLLSLLGSILVYASAFSQWWFSSNYPEIVISFAAIVSSFCLFIFSVKKVLIPIYSLIFIIFSVNFLLHLYPPFLVPLIYLGGFIVVAFLLSKEINQYLENHLAYKTMLIFLSLLVLGCTTFYFYLEARTTIDAIQNTSYPGKRVSSGGGNLWRIFTGYFDTFSFHQSKFPIFLGNVCEASTFYMFSLALLPLIYGKENLYLFKNPIVLSLIAYIVIAFIWSSLGFGKKISHYSLMELSPPTRSLIGIGIANILLFIVLLSLYDKEIKSSKNTIIVRLILGIILTSGIIALGFYLNKLDENYYSNKRILLSGIIFFSITVFLIFRKIKLLILLCLLISLSALKVNPLVYGLSGFKNKEIANFLEKNNLISSHRIAFFGSIVHPQYLKAIGVNVFGGVSFLPDHQSISILDPEKKYTQVWNRYAHIQLNMDPQSKAPKFLLSQADLYTISLNPCGDEFRRLGIKYLAFLNDVDEQIRHCAYKINPLPINGVYFYKTF